MSTLTLAPDIESLKSRLRTTWMAGDYDRFSRFMENDARSFYERLDVPPGAHLLDVACGSGQLALIAAREGVRVTGVDIAGQPHRAGPGPLDGGKPSPRISRSPTRTARVNRFETLPDGIY